MSDATTTSSSIGTPYRDLLHTQSYGATTHIQGVEIVDLRLSSDEGGDFCEIARFVPGGMLAQFPKFSPAQINYSMLEPGTIKAWHVHHKQDDLWFVLPGNRLLVGLLDLRDESPTYQSSMRMTLGAGRARLLLIPTGVAHGVANLTQNEAGMIYLVNQAFDPSNPDEHRLPYDLLGTEFWTNRPG